MSWLAEALRWPATVLAYLATAYVATYHVLNLTMILLAWAELRRQSRYRTREAAEAASASDQLPGISVVIPAFNEEATVCRTVESILASHYPQLEVIVVNDGSTDRTLAVLDEKFRLDLSTETCPTEIPTQAVRAVFVSKADPRLVVLDKRNGGKADALNAGISFTRMPLCCVIDADVILDRRALLSLALPFVEDDSTVASSGTIRLQNGCRQKAGRITEVGVPRRLVERIQVVEYIRAFCLGRLFFNALGAHLLISGAFGLFRRSILAEIGGFQPTAIGEDMELVLRIHRHLRAKDRPYRITFVADALCFTEGPHSLRDLGKQRTRWHQGLLTSLRLHRSMMLNPGFGVLGWLAMPYFVAFELASPVIETLGWIAIPVTVALGLVHPVHLVFFLVAAVVLGTGVSLIAILLDDLHLAFFPRFGQLLSLCWSSVLEHFGYHQATLWFRLRAFAKFYGTIHIRGGWVSPQRQAPGRR